jgi:hypothetical protein
VGQKAERDFGENFFWVLGGIPEPGQDVAFEYYIVPSQQMAKQVGNAHQLWLDTPGQKGQPHRPTSVRTVHLPPRTSISGWSLEGFRERWDLIEEKLR